MPKYTNGLMLMAMHNLVMTPPKQGHFDTLNIPTTPSPSNISAPLATTMKPLSYANKSYWIVLSKNAKPKKKFKKI
jgi:hypothetical protein